MKIVQNTVVTLNYKLSDESGKLIDSSETNGPLIYLHGRGMMMPGIENVVDGKETGFTFSGVIEPEEGYGDYDPSGVIPVPREQFAHLVDQMEEGKFYNFDLGGGQTQMLKVVKIDDKFVTVDSNHPYAGETLNLECSVLEVREASLDELEHSHSGCGCGGHDDGGCCSGGHDSDSGCCGSHEGDGCGCGGHEKRKEKGCGCGGH